MNSRNDPMREYFLKISRHKILNIYNIGKINQILILFFLQKTLLIASILYISNPLISHVNYYRYYIADTTGRTCTHDAPSALDCFCI